ncbi:hypothetical protein [Celeribacter baekdonensis]|uniref:hypothetical protein n=1 Tax=Celeribacter baekdonensis TaxID=875171 RepID=UPI00125EA6EB|nr:hypothetical protein [Celeribacter baekdonensis]
MKLIENSEYLNRIFLSKRAQVLRAKAKTAVAKIEWQNRIDLKWLNHIESNLCSTAIKSDNWAQHVISKLCNSLFLKP